MQTQTEFRHILANESLEDWDMLFIFVINWFLVFAVVAIPLGFLFKALGWNPQDAASIAMIAGIIVGIWRASKT